MVSVPYFSISDSIFLIVCQAKKYSGAKSIANVLHKTIVTEQLHKQGIESDASHPPSVYSCMCSILRLILNYEDLSHNY